MVTILPCLHPSLFRMGLGCMEEGSFDLLSFLVQANSNLFYMTGVSGFSPPFTKNLTWAAVL